MTSGSAAQHVLLEAARWHAPSRQLPLLAWLVVPMCALAPPPFYASPPCRSCWRRTDGAPPLLRILCPATAAMMSSCRSTISSCRQAAVDADLASGVARVHSSERRAAQQPWLLECCTLWLGRPSHRTRSCSGYSEPAAASASQQRHPQENKIDYNARDKNPLDAVHFFDSLDASEKRKLRPDQISSMVVASYQVSGGCSCLVASPFLAAVVGCVHAWESAAPRTDLEHCGGLVACQQSRRVASGGLNHVAGQ